ncbi:MAG: hypothetical protein ABI894_11520 [Ilumatobacteraceae bacterium]
MAAYDKKLKEGAQPFLDEGEQVLAAFIARPRGWTQSMAGARPLGHAQMSENTAGAAASGFELASPMALAVTQRRLLTLSIGSPIGLGIGGKVKGIAGSAPLSAVDSIEIQRLAVGKTITVTIEGQLFKLEANAAADAKGFVETFEHAKSG